MAKKLLSLALALILCLGILAGCDTQPQETTQSTTKGTEPATTTQPTETTEPEPTTLFDPADEVVIQMWMPNNKDLDTEGCYANLAIEAAIGAKVEITEWEGEQYLTQMAAQKVPMLVYQSKHSNDEYGLDGAFINWYDYLDQMPNVKALMESEQWASHFEAHAYSDEVSYGLPILQTGALAVYGYIYRADIFEKHNLEFPTTQEEFYDTLVKLKELYPDSYPFVERQMNGNMQGLQAWANNWGAHHTLGGNTFDADTKTYYYGQITDEYKEACRYMKNLLDEELMHPSSLSMATNDWIEAFATGTSFITYDKMDRIPAMMAGADLSANPDFMLVGGAPIAMGENGVVATEEIGAHGYSLSVSALLDEEDLNNVLKYVDWLYSEEGILVTNWGVEGESYEVDADGNKAWKEDFTYAGSGLGVASQCAYYDFSAYLAAQPDNIREAFELNLPYCTVPKNPSLTYTDEEMNYISTYAMPLYEASLANLQKFILGQRDIDTEWDDHIAELQALKMDELIQIDIDAYARKFG